MFNEDQRSHMKVLAELPGHLKCKCGWNYIWDCYNCNREELKNRGGIIDNENYVLPDKTKTDYAGLCKWLRDVAATENASVGLRRAFLKQAELGGRSHRRVVPLYLGNARKPARLILAISNGVQCEA